jgi:5'(3')-deoxyribonucleotidase
MVKFSQKYFQDTKILTASPNYEAPKLGKTYWIENNIGNIPIIFTHSGREKGKYAGPNKILIDDKAENIRAFEKSGGIGILFDNNPQEIIDQLLKILKGESQPLNENATYSQHIDYKQQIKDLTKHMLDKGMNIKPLPKVVFYHGNQENAQDFFGKTAYYNPNTMEIVLYTEGRHPRDIISSFCHEIIHHIQNIEGRLGNIVTSNILEDDNLEKLEREAYENGGIMLRAFKDFMRNIS